MKRRALLQMPLLLLSATTLRAATPPWTLRLLKGGFDGTFYWSGIAISLAANWKTYWRVPGDGGIAPHFEVTGDNLKSHRVDYPAPERYIDEAGMTIGYKNEVVFPLSLQPEDLTQPMTVKFKTFFGVCDVVCIPAQFEGDLIFDAAKSDAPDQATIAQWRNKVPVHQASGPVMKATAKAGAGKPELVLEFSEAIASVFIEGNPKHYFGRPLMLPGSVIFPVNGAKTLEDLRTTPLRVTVSMQNGRPAAIEQMVNVL